MCYIFTRVPSGCHVSEIQTLHTNESWIHCLIWTILKNKFFHTSHLFLNGIDYIFKCHLFMSWTAQVVLYVIAFSLQGQIKRVFLQLFCSTHPFILLNLIQTANSSEYDLFLGVGCRFSSANVDSAFCFVLIDRQCSPVQLAGAYVIAGMSRSLTIRPLLLLVWTILNWLSGLRYVSFQPLQTRISFLTLAFKS